MADERSIDPTSLSASERDALTADARLIRRTRWRLVALSGGMTLIVLLVLGAAIYAAVSRSLAESGTKQLAARAETIADFVNHPAGPGRPPPIDLTFGGADSGTFAFLVAGDGRVFGPQHLDWPEGLPDADAVDAARANGRDVRQVTVADVPLRVLSDADTGPDGTFVVQVIQDRSAEQRTLDVLLAVLVVGGLLGLVAAIIVGAAYAQRALVPVRRSLTGQRLALRRQREFAADASHELRTPLTIVRASVEDLQRHADEPVRAVGSALDDIQAEVGHLTSLVDDLLLLARSDSGALDLSLQPVELGDVAADAASAMAVAAAASGVHIEVDPAPVMVVGDATRLRQLITILTDNAVHHSPNGGTVSVRVRREGRDATLSVDDQGPGIPVEELARVFDRFWRSPGAPSGGTGLGLAIAATIVTRHGGRIGVTNRPQGGARFMVTLPAMADVTGTSSSVSPRMAEPEAQDHPIG